MNIKLSINTSKIDKTEIFRGKKGNYLDIVLIENKDGPDQYGQDGFAAHDVSKEEREAGVKGVIVGNWKYLGKPAGGQRCAAPAQRPTSRPFVARPASADPDLDADGQDTVPF